MFKRLSTLAVVTGVVAISLGCDSGVKDAPPPKTVPAAPAGGFGKTEGDGGAAKPAGGGGPAAAAAPNSKQS